mmetsp:Transcript_15700/g.28194  ORF Transcript_15700/g.28194 Transcript_15700/m.28194 type:complete len:144 (-) Transcript_15700:447-878(-)
MSASGKISCQHGEQECEGNRWEQCAIAHYPDQNEHFEFYYCMEKEADQMLTKVDYCAKQAGMDYEVLQKCYNSAESAALQKKAAAMTPSDHKYVPWVVVNGKKSASDGDRILQEVCDAYTGNPPKACASLEASKRWRRCHNEL